MQLPQIIQGGMGAAISDWRLARAVSTHGGLGVVSGTALDEVLSRRLQTGDLDGHLRRALAAFPRQDIVDRVLERHFIPGGKGANEPFRKRRLVGTERDADFEALTVAANFVEVYLAKEGHDGPIGINYLHKMLPTLPAALHGAMLAGVAVVIVGAGIPLDVPDLLEGLSRHEQVEAMLHVRNATSGATHKVTYDPNDTFPGGAPPLQRPKFLPIVSSAALAALMLKKCAGKIDGLIVEAATAGGHNAPPRGRMSLNLEGEPIYGKRDTIDLGAIAALGLPFWLAGSHGSPEQLVAARNAGAAGIQVGTLFAFCQESGLRPDIKRSVIDQRGDLRVFTDPLASPTGFPFKVLSLPNTLSEDHLYAERPRRCDLGFLREPYEKDNGDLGWRCPAEHPDVYVHHGGRREDTVGRKCLCNGLVTNVGMPQVRNNGYVELPLVTCGDDLSGIAAVMGQDPDVDKTGYSAAEAIDYLLATTS